MQYIDTSREPAETRPSNIALPSAPLLASTYVSVEGRTQPHSTTLQLNCATWEGGGVFFYARGTASQPRSGPPEPHLPASKAWTWTCTNVHVRCTCPLDGTSARHLPCPQSYPRFAGPRCSLPGLLLLVKARCHELAKHAKVQLVRQALTAFPVSS